MTTMLRAPRTWRHVLALGLLALFGVVVAAYLTGVALDFRAAAGFPGELDYGEGIVWQQALLMFGPRMYSPSQALPFIVFHYPPLYHFVVRGLMSLGADPLAGGRLVSMVSAVVALVAGALVMLEGLERRAGWRDYVLVAAVSGALLLLHASRIWAALMRVDMLAIALGTVATLVAIRSGGRIWALTLSLLLCVAAVYTKQTHLPVGIAIFVVAAICWRRAALWAAGIAGGVGLAALTWLQLSTGGFLKNIISYNINPWDMAAGLDLIWSERTSFPFLGLALLAALLSLVRLRRRPSLAALRAGHAPAVAEAIVLIHFVLACLMLVTLFKLGAWHNYFLDTFYTGSILIGLMLCRGFSRPLLQAAGLAVLLLASLNEPYRIQNDAQLAQRAAENAPVIAAIRAADKPVAADLMLLVMQAGKSLVYEPAIIESLIDTHQYDPAPLLDMIRSHGFAFAVTRVDIKGGERVAQAIREAYPVVEHINKLDVIRRPAATQANPGG